MYNFCTNRLVSQINSAIEKVAINEELKNFLFTKINEEASANLSNPSPATNINNRISETDKKLNLLLDGYIGQVISEEEYKRKKSSLLNGRLELKEKLTSYDGKGKAWLEPARIFVTSAGQTSYIANRGSLEEKREFVKKIGSNFRLSGVNLFFDHNLPYKFLAEKNDFENWGG